MHVVGCSLKLVCLAVPDQFIVALEIELVLFCARRRALMKECHFGMVCSMEIVMDCKMRFFINIPTTSSLLLLPLSVCRIYQ